MQREEGQGEGCGVWAITAEDTNYNVIYLPPSGGKGPSWLAGEKINRVSPKSKDQDRRQGHAIGYWGGLTGRTRGVGIRTPNLESAIKLANECQLLLWPMALMS